MFKFLRKPKPKYEILRDDSKEFKGQLLFRIRALRDFRFIHEGELGGYIGSHQNLSHRGNCWVYSHAYVAEDAVVSGNAYVFGESRVYGWAKIMGDAYVTDQSHMSGDAIVKGKATICTRAHISGNAIISGRGIVGGVARVSGDAHVLRDALVSENTKLNKGKVKS